MQGAVVVWWVTLTLFWAGCTWAASTKNLWGSVLCCAKPQWRWSIEHLGSQQSQWNQPICVLELPGLGMANVHLPASLRHTVKESQQGDLGESFINNNTWKMDGNLFTKMEWWAWNENSLKMYDQSNKTSFVLALAACRGKKGERESYYTDEEEMR